MRIITRENWHLVRILQLLFGVFCLVDFLLFSQEGTVLALGLILLFQAFTNWQFGCVSGQCRR